MNRSPSARRRALLSAVVSALVIVPVTGASAQIRRPARGAAPKPAVADNRIIPLPLNPIVPAGQRVCAARTATGLGYTVLRPGSAEKPGADATALVNYVGYLAATGAVFDQNMQTPMPVAGVIAGFSQGLQMTGRGGVVRLCIPAALGYGAQASGPIPANADLVFQVELLDFKTAAEIEALRKDPAAGTAPATPSQP